MDFQPAPSPPFRLPETTGRKTKTMKYRIDTIRPLAVLAKVRYVVEQSFGTLHRKFRYARAAYFGLSKVRAQSHLKAMCVNLLKAANRIRVPVAA
ncbi:transposase [Neisseria shayeganii]|uniref:transposase n=1 Tax=Neisseria shayeganii TaxID=607712 RepID=UPI003CC8174D